jgi:hypothetical protein
MHISAQPQAGLTGNIDTIGLYTVSTGCLVKDLYLIGG